MTTPTHVMPAASPRHVGVPEHGGRIDAAIALIAASVVMATVPPILMAAPSDGDRAQAPAARDAAILARPPETIVAGYGGITHTHSSDVHFAKAGMTDLTAQSVDWIGRPFKSPIYYGLRAIYWPAGSRVGGMLDFTHAKTISVREQAVRFSGTRNGRPANGTATIDKTFRHLEFSHGHNMLTLNGLLRLGAVTAAIRPYVGGGLGVSLPHTEVQFVDDAKRTYEYQFAGGVGQALAGIEFRLPSFSVFIEYKLSVAPYRVPLSQLDGSKSSAFQDWWVQFRNWLSGAAPEGGYLSTTLTTHHLIAGVGYRHSIQGAAPR